MSEPILIEVDNRRRVSLSKLGDPKQRHYLVSVDANGVITLRPALVMSRQHAKGWAVAAAERLANSPHTIDEQLDDLEETIAELTGVQSERPALS